jgi:hypothetical protein
MATKRVRVGKPSPALAASAQAKDGDAAQEDSTEIRTTGISLPAWALELLLDVANKRKKSRGGRASVSAILLELVEQNRSALQAELK